jgi:protein-disulfide isomerase
MHDIVFDNQQHLDDASLLHDAQAATLDIAQYQSCMARADDAHISRDSDLATQLGLRGTPVFYIGTINSRGLVDVTANLSGAQPEAPIAAALDAALRTAPPFVRP